MGRKSRKTEKPQVNPELSGFEVSINEFGEIQSNMDVSVLNTFLDKRIDDKKFRGVQVIKRDLPPDTDTHQPEQ
jgi:hypothetical protein